MDEGQIQDVEEMEIEDLEERLEFIRKAREGKVKWGAWRYNPHNLTLEFDTKLNSYPPNSPYYVDLKRCNTARQILDWLLQLMEKSWCPTEQVGYLLRAMNDLAGDLHGVVWGEEFNMGKHLRELGQESDQKLLTVQEVADVLRVKKLTLYRMIKKKKLSVINLPIGRGRKGEIRIPQKEVDRILGKHGAEEES